MKYWIIVLFLFVSAFSSAQIDKPTYTKAYNLHFRFGLDTTTLYSWRGNAAYGLSAVPFYKKEENQSLFTLIYLKSFPFEVKRLRTEWEQRILLPEYPEHKGTVSFESKGENIDKAFLFIDGIDSKERIIYSDTIQYRPNISLSTLSKDISLKGVELLNFRIRGEGMKEQNAQFTFSKLDIRIGNQPIDSFPVRKLSSLPIQENKPKTVSINKSMDAGYSKIIGIGESVHGNSEVREFAYSFILKRVESHHCKSVLLERPMEECLIYDSYIQGLSCQLDSNDYYLKEMNLISFLNKLKDYNATRKMGERVRLWGIDYQKSSIQETASSIFDYLISMNKEWKAPEIDRLAVLLMTNDWIKTFLYLNENKKTLEGLFPEFQYKYIEHLLKLSVAVGADPIGRFIKRDSIMFENARFIIDNAPDKDAEIVMYAHATHLNTVSTYPVVPSTPLGAYLKGIYGENYTPLLVLVDKGESTVYDSRNSRVDLTLSTPPCESMEYFLSSIAKEDTYMPLTPDFDRLVLSRFIGSHGLRQQFFWFNLYRRYAGIFFMIKKLETPVGKVCGATFEEMSKQNADRIKNRQKILEMLKKTENDNTNVHHEK